MKTLVVTLSITGSSECSTPTPIETNHQPPTMIRGVLLSRTRYLTVEQNLSLTSPQSPFPTRTAGSMPRTRSRAVILSNAVG